MRVLMCDGVEAFWLDFDRRRVSGWTHLRPVVGDELRCAMQSGRVARFRFIAVEYPFDPPDQYFATVADVDYE